MNSYAALRSITAPSTGELWDFGSLNAGATLGPEVRLEELRAGSEEPEVGPVTSSASSDLVPLASQSQPMPELQRPQASEPASGLEAEVEVPVQPSLHELWIPIGLEDMSFATVDHFHSFINSFCRGQIGNGISDTGPTGWAVTKACTRRGDASAMFICVCGRKDVRLARQDHAAKTARKRRNGSGNIVHIITFNLFL